MTNRQVNILEDTLRTSQNLIEEAGRMVCSEPGPGGQLWTELTVLGNKIGELFQYTWKLRPEDDVEEETFTVYDLSKEQLHQLKINFIRQLDEEGSVGDVIFNDPDRELTDADIEVIDNIIDDEFIVEKFQDKEFTKEEFEDLKG